jgi:DNA-binding NarL/FixJ family response regulator
VAMDEKTIMVIDADEGVQHKIQESFADKPCRFVFVDQAGDSIVQLAMESPDVVIAALELPDGGGVDLIENIRDFNDSVYLVVLTGAPTKEKLIAAKRAKAIDILLKPPDYTRLAAKISTYLWVHPDLLTGKEGEGGEADAAPPPEPEPFIEAVPKGAEVLNINDAIGGMKVARTLMFNNVVFADKGQILTDEKILKLNRMGVPEICVYIDIALKKKAELRRKAEMAKPVMGVKTQTGDKSFSKVKRQQVRVKVSEPAKITRTLKDGATVELDGVVADVSGGGCALLTADPLIKDEQILINFTMDEGKFLMKDTRGIVRHSMRRFGTDQFPQHTGIFFNSITEKFRENLITVLFKIERDNKKKEDELRARYGYGPKRPKPPR